jgi:1-acyl-sn-glycerol-3-phosphate acyltransferase
MTALRSALFNIVFLPGMAIGCLFVLPFGLVSRRAMMAAVLTYMRFLRWTERWILGLDYRVLGREHVPGGPCIVAAKHQSTWETMKLHLLLDDPAVVLKSELSKIPLWGWYARRAGMIAVERGAGARAINGMVRDAKERVAEGRPIVIFPQGTRVPPGEWRPYRSGVGALYTALDLPVVPMALNSGVFWGRRAASKRGGTVTVEFLPPIPPGLPQAEMMERLERELETASDRLSAAAGGPVVSAKRAAPAVS